MCVFVRKYMPYAFHCIQTVTCLLGSIMGSDNGHSNGLSYFVSTEWSHGEREFLRFVTSQRIATLFLSIMAEGMVYNYTVGRMRLE